MLSPYKYVKHDLEIVQEFVDYIFCNVWIKSKPSQDFSPDLFHNKVFKKLFLDLYCTGNIPTDKFCRNVEEIYNIINKLPKIKKEKLSKFYKINSNIKSLCENTYIKPISYKQLEEIDHNLSKKIKDFNDLLYGSGSILGKLEELLQISGFSDHYYKFIEKNKNICLFCGLDKLVTVDGYRSDYDHFLQKAKYPFVSINLKNLAPACDLCNKKFKNQKDPLYHKSERKKNKPIFTRRKSIYPYSTNSYKFSISINFVNLLDSKGTINPENVNIKILTKSNNETNTWNNLFNIPKRYKDVCSIKDEALNWISSAQKCMDISSMNVEQYIKFEKARYEETSKYHEINFLKIPFLEACKEANII